MPVDKVFYKSTDAMSNVMSTSPMIHVACERIPKKEFEVDIAHTTTSTGTGYCKALFPINDKKYNYNYPKS